MFRCKWVKNNNGIKIDELQFTLVDLNKKVIRGKLFIMAFYAKQVFSITNLDDKKWFVMLHNKRKVVGDGNEEDMTNDIKDTPTFSSTLPLVNDEGNLKESYM